MVQQFARQGEYGSYRMVLGAVTPINPANAWAKIQGSTELLDSYRFDSAGDDNRLYYRGRRPAAFRITAHATLAATVVGNAYIAIALGGVQLTESEQGRRISVPNEIGNMGTSFVLELAPGEYVEVFCSHSAIGNITVSKLNVVASPAS